LRNSTRLIRGSPPAAIVNATKHAGHNS
jgi:hypothetical protein